MVGSRPWPRIHSLHCLRLLFQSSLDLLKRQTQHSQHDAEVKGFIPDHFQTSRLCYRGIPGVFESPFLPKWSERGNIGLVLMGTPTSDHIGSTNTDCISLRTDIQIVSFTQAHSCRRIVDRRLQWCVCVCVCVCACEDMCVCVCPNASKRPILSKLTFESLPCK